jgi:type IV secretory pathway VirB9-like protein
MMNLLQPGRRQRSIAPVTLVAVIATVACAGASSSGAIHPTVGGQGNAAASDSSSTDVVAAQRIPERTRSSRSESEDTTHMESRAAKSNAPIVASTAVALRGPKEAEVSARDTAPPSHAANGIVTVAFGQASPVLTCTVLRACLVELEAGETLVEEPIAGDHARWIVARARTGPGGSSAIVVVKPKACDIATNLVLSTDRRVYDLDLESPPCKPGNANLKKAYTRRVRFEYPSEGVRPADSHSGERGRDSSNKPVGQAARKPALLPVGEIVNRDYQVARDGRGPFGVLGHKKVDFPWTPSAIADDGAHVYIVMPSIAKRHAAPVLYALEDDGSRTMMNFTMQDSVIVTDRVFRRGVFVLATGSHEQTLEFENRSWGKAADQIRRP